MSITEKHLEIIASKLKEIKQQHKYKMLSVKSEPLKVKFNPNQPFKIDFFETYSELSKNELSIYIKNIKTELLNVLDKMNITKLNLEDKERIKSLLKELLEPKFYSSSFDSFESNLKGKYNSYGLKFNNEETNHLERKYSYHKGLNESFINNKIRQFFLQISTELDILILNSEEKQNTFLSNEGIIGSEVSVFGVKVRINKLLAKFKR